MTLTLTKRILWFISMSIVMLGSTGILLYLSSDINVESFHVEILGKKGLLIIQTQIVNKICILYGFSSLTTFCFYVFDSFSILRNNTSISLNYIVILLKKIKYKYDYFIKNYTLIGLSKVFNNIEPFSIMDDPFISDIKKIDPFEEEDWEEKDYGTKEEMDNILFNRVHVRHQRGIYI